MSTEWKLVPMHPTEEMIQATLDTGLYHDGEEAARAVLIDEYKAMVKAAPPAPQPTEAETSLTDEQIEAGRREIFSTDNPFCPCDSKTMRKAVRWAEKAHGIKVTR